MHRIANIISYCLTCYAYTPHWRTSFAYLHILNLHVQNETYIYLHYIFTHIHIFQYIYTHTHAWRCIMITYTELTPIPKYICWILVFTISRDHSPQHLPLVGSVPHTTYCRVFWQDNDGSVYEVAPPKMIFIISTLRRNRLLYSFKSWKSAFYTIIHI